MGEPLLASQRTLFEEVFACPVFDVYVSRECGHLAGECEEHQGMHINADCLHLEFVDDDDQPVPPGEMGRILVTDFGNYGMPFIRYEIGDMGAADDRPCPCGRTLPLMKFAAGRESDFIKSPHDGSLISGATLCHYLLAEGPNVGQLQLVQEKPDELLVRICNDQAEEDRRAFRIRGHKVLNDIFHHSMKIRCQQVPEIPAEKSGKYRFCINRTCS